MTAMAQFEALSEHLQKRIAGRRAVAGVFLTYQYEPAFFEQDLLPVLLGASASHASTIRRMQVEEALRASGAEFAVYYDADALVISDEGSAWQDIRRIPVRITNGCFHPKNFFLLVQDATAPLGAGPTALLVGCMSANLTRAGWWRNVEVAHFEEIAAGDRTRMRDSLLAFLHAVPAWARSAVTGDHSPLRRVQAFLSNCRQIGQRSRNGKVLPHFVGGRSEFLSFLDDAAGQWLRGSCLEVLSPFFDDADRCRPLDDLVARFRLAQVRVLEPRAHGADAVACRKGLYAAVAEMPNVQWGRLPLQLATGKGAAAEQRFVHAKVYRFFQPGQRWELVLAGSPNLTTAAHAAKGNSGNVESAMLVESELTHGASFWLEPVSAPPTVYASPGELDGAGLPGSPLSLRYNWQQRRAEAWWDGTKPSPELALLARGTLLFNLPELPPRTWRELPPDAASQLQGALQHTSLAVVRDGLGNESHLLVREEGMSHKPSWLLQLSIEDILRYWALLTAAQQASLIEARMAEFVASSPGADVVVAPMRLAVANGFFDRFAGIFQSFACVERAIVAALQSDREADAVSRLFGRKVDSLHTMLIRLCDPATKSAASGPDAVHRYVIALCARQALQATARNFPQFWSRHPADANELNQLVERAMSTKRQLTDLDGEVSAEFLRWFESWFVKRAVPVRGAQ